MLDNLQVVRTKVINFLISDNAQIGDSFNYRSFAAQNLIWFEDHQELIYEVLDLLVVDGFLKKVDNEKIISVNPRLMK